MARARRVRDAQRRLRLQRHRRPRSRPAGRADPPAAAGERARVAALGLAADRAAVPDRARRAAPAQPDRGDRRAGQHRAGRGLSVHEADHLVAAGVARAGLLLGRAGRLAGGDRKPRPGRRCCCGSEASPGWSATTRSTRSRTSRTTRWSASNRRRGGSATRRRSAIAHLLRRRACCCGARRSGRVRPDWLALRALVPAALHLASQALRADPGDGELALALFRSNRTCGLLVFLAMLVVGLSAR